MCSSKASIFIAVITILGLACPAQVVAQGHDEAAVGRVQTAGGGSARSQAESWIVPPEETLVVGGGLTVLTSTEELEPLVGVPELTQTDIVMLGLTTRYAWGQRVELYGAGAFLPKKPSVVDAKFWQTATLGALISLSKRESDEETHDPYSNYSPFPKFALWIQADGGTLLDDLGYWNSAVVGARYQQAIDEFVRLKASAGVNGTALWLEDFGLDVPRFAEAMVGGEIVFGDARSGAVWLGTEFYFPFYSSAGGTNDDLGTEYVLDPTTRANIHIGGALTFIENWDIYMEISLLDRGELDRIETTLPKLSEGFDQTTVTLGLNHRWTFEDDESGPPGQ
ncbi:MAG: hypothetical protein ACQEVA_02590 [Myxococcota bacterium]